MRKELRDKLLNDFPDLFPKKNPLYREDLNIPFYIDCDDGWYKLVYDLCADIRKLLKEDPVDKFMVVQVKEKFGGLRFYIGCGTEKIFSRIHQAEEESFKICEFCGQPGVTRIDLFWRRTLCDECYKKQLEEYKKK